jgi:hypothetical protein
MELGQGQWLQLWLVHNICVGPDDIMWEMLTDKKKSVNSVTTICRWILDQQRKQHSFSSAKKRQSNLLLLIPMMLRVLVAIAAVSLMKDQLKYFASISIPSSTHVNGAYGRSSLTTLTAARSLDDSRISDDKLLETQEPARRVLEELRFAE